LEDAESNGKHGDNNPVYTELNLLVRSLLESPNNQDHLACTTMLLTLATMDALEKTQKVRLMIQLGSLFKKNDMAVCVEAAEVYKRVIQKKWPEVVPLVEKELNQSFEWLENGRNEVRWITALLLLETLCGSGIPVVCGYTLKVLNCISPLLRSPKLELRLQAARTFDACLTQVPRQDEMLRSILLNHVSEELMKDRQLGTVEGFHAALFRCQGLLQYGGMFMQTHFQEASEMALKLKDHRDPIICKKAISLFPVLAQYSPKSFANFRINGSTLLATISDYLISQVRTNERERASSFLSLASIAHCCRDDFGCFLEPTTKAIREILMQHTKDRNTKNDADENTTAVLRTIAVLAKAFGSSLTKHMHEILDLMFTTGLSQALCESLADIGNSIPQLRKPIQDRLLDMVSIVLVNMPFRSVQPSLDSIETRIGTISLHYTPNISTRESLIVGLTGPAPIASAMENTEPSVDGLNDSSTTLDTIGRSQGNSASNSALDNESKTIGLGSESMSLVVSAAKKIVVTDETLIFALRILSSFNFSTRNLSEFVTNSLIPYLTHGSAAVRRSAIHAITHILISDPLYDMIAGAGFDVTADVVQRLIASAVTDIDPEVRQMAVCMLEKGRCFDFHMGKSENIQSLFLLLNDEVFDVRLTAISIVGRVVNVNPSYVMPLMRCLIVQLLTQLESARELRDRNESTQMIMMLVLSANNSLYPYVDDILRTILPCINDGPPQLVSKLFETIAALAQVNSSAMVPYANKILTCIIQTLSNSSSWQKRMSALKALGNCASYCNMVIDPYKQHPRLFSILLRLLKTESEEMKEEIMRVIGALGAIEPHQYKDLMNQQHILEGPSMGISSMSGSSASTSRGTNSHAAGAIADANNVTDSSIACTGAGTGTCAGRHGSLLGKKHSRNAGKRYGKRNGGPPPNFVTVFNSEMPRESLVGDIRVDSYGTEFTSDPSYYISVSVNALLRILNSPANANSHLLAVQALNTMFAPLQNVCGQYLDSVVPAILRAMKAAPPEAAESYIERLGRLVGIARQLIRPYLDPLFDLFDSDAVISEQRQNVLIGLVEVMVDSLSGNLGQYTKKVIVFLISVIDRDVSNTRRQALNAIHALQILSPSLDNYLFLIMPRLIALLDLEKIPMNVVIKALKAIQSIASSVSCRSFASRIVLTLVKLLQTSSELELQASIIDTLCILMEQLQNDFTLFMPTINAVMKKCN
ncbi:phosphatidylinositol kinase- protein kinase tor1, partial [Coemansia sp. RSA 2599]